MAAFSEARRRLGDTVETTTRWAAGLLFCTLLLVNIVQVGARTMSESLIWVTDLSQLMLLWMVMLGTVSAYCSNEHILTGFLDTRLRGRPLDVLLIVLRILEATFFLILMVAGYSVTSVRAEIPYVQLGISTAWTYAAIPSAAFLLLLASAALPLRRPEAPARDDIQLPETVKS